MDCLEEITSSEANDKIWILLSRKESADSGKSTRKEKHSFSFVKTIVSIICIRITVEKGRQLLGYYCKMLKELGECIIYISENWVSQKSEHVREVQVRLSKVIGFILYFLHREIRCRDGDAKEFLTSTLNDIMAAIFVIVLKKYPKDHEHAPTDTQAAKVISIVLNCFFEKSDKSLLFTRKDIENHQAKDYQSIAAFLTTDLCHEFFEESKHFKMMKKEFYKESYIDIVSRERYYYAKKVKIDQDTRDYQEKKKYQEISADINDKHNTVKMKDEYIKKETLMWIDPYPTNC